MQDKNFQCIHRICQHSLRKPHLAQAKLWSLFGPGLPLHIKNKILMYVLFQRSVQSYNIIAWDEVCQTWWNKLQVFQKKPLRIALVLRPHPITYRQSRNSVVHPMVNVPTLKDFSERLKMRFYAKAARHQNPIIANLKSR